MANAVEGPLPIPDIPTAMKQPPSTIHSYIYNSETKAFLISRMRRSSRL
jgi:hypothetical protein